MNFFKSFSALAVLGCITTPVLAQLAPQADSLTNALQSVTIHGSQRNSPSLQYNVNRKKLDAIQGNTLGATLAHIPGIQNSSFGPNAGGPVIRSLSGNRVNVMLAGLTLNNLSGISPNFNITAEQDNISGMQVYRGSASVLFGGRAIGGAINIIPASLPQALPDRPLSGSFSVQGATNAGSRQSLQLQGGALKHFAWFVSGSNAQNGLLRIPGQSKVSWAHDPAIMGFNSMLQAAVQVNVNSAHVLNTSLFPYIDQFVLNHLGDPEWGLSEDDKWTNRATYFDSESHTYKPNQPNPAYKPGQDPVKDRYTDVVKEITDYAPLTSGEIPKSKAFLRTANGGISYFKNNFSAGIAYQGSLNNYGIPAYAMQNKPAHSHDPAYRFTPVYVPINVHTYTNSLLAQALLTFTHPVFTGLSFNYLGQFNASSELLGNYMANRFNVSQHGLRTQFSQHLGKYLSGNTGADFNFAKIAGAGQRRYMPNTLSREAGVYTIQQLNVYPFSLSAGYRYNYVGRAVTATQGYTPGCGLAGGKLSAKNFNLHQFSSALALNLLKSLQLNGSFKHSERAPDVNELYTGSTHFAIVTEENGDDRLKKEFVNTIEGGLTFTLPNLSVKATVYQAEYKNYIYLAHTGISRGGFVVKEWRQDDTRINGTEIEAAYTLNLHRAGSWQFNGYYDIVRNINTSASSIRRWSDGDYMPDMPASRFGFGLQNTIGKFNAGITADRYLKQKYLAKNISDDIPMPAYTLLSARLGYKGRISGRLVEYILSGDNLLNIEARPQNSPMRYLSPLSGINITAGIKLML